MATATMRKSVDALRDADALKYVGRLNSRGVLGSRAVPKVRKRIFTPSFSQGDIENIWRVMYLHEVREGIAHQHRLLEGSSNILEEDPYNYGWLLYLEAVRDVVEADLVAQAGTTTVRDLSWQYIMLAQDMVALRNLKSYRSWIMRRHGLRRDIFFRQHTGMIHASASVRVPGPDVVNVVREGWNDAMMAADFSVDSKVAAR